MFPSDFYYCGNGRCWPFLLKDSNWYRRKLLKIVSNTWFKSQNTKLQKIARFVMMTNQSYIPNHRREIFTYKFVINYWHCAMAIDMDCWQVDHISRATVCAERNSLPPVCCPSHHRLSTRLHIWETSRDEAPQGCTRPGNVWGNLIDDSTLKN